MRSLTSRNRWVALGIGIAVQSLGGLLYMFGVYSPLLKQKYQLNQANLQLIGALSNIGGNVGVHTGLLYDRFGPKLTLCGALLIGFTGFLGMWGALADVWTLSVGGIAAMAFLQGQAQLWTDVSVVPTMGKNFPNNRGLVLGITKSFVGLAGALVTTVYTGIFKPNVVPFMQFLAAYWACVCTLGLIFVHRAEPTGVDGGPTTKQLRTAAGFSIALALVILTGAFVEQFFPGRIGGLEITVSVVVLFLTLIVSTAMNSNRFSSAGTVKSLNDPSDTTEGSPLLASPGEPQTKSYNLLQAAKGVSFWLLFLCFFIGGGSGLVLINNVSQMVKAFGGHAGTEDVMVSIISVCNFFGRLFAGGIGDALLQRGVTRPMVFAGSILLMAVTHAVLIAATIPALYIACFTGGLAYGAFNSLCPTIILEVYGPDHMASIYTTNSLALASGSYAFATGIAGSFYYKAREHMEPPSSFCVGRACYMPTNIICGALCAACALAAAALGRNTRRRYAALYPKFLRLQS